MHIQCDYFTSKIWLIMRLCFKKGENKWNLVNAWIYNVQHHYGKLQYFFSAKNAVTTMIDTSSLAGLLDQKGEKYNNDNLKIKKRYIILIFRATLYCC